MIRLLAASSCVFIMASDFFIKFTDVCKPLRCEVIVQLNATGSSLSVFGWPANIDVITEAGVNGVYGLIYVEDAVELSFRKVSPRQHFLHYQSSKILMRELVFFPPDSVFSRTNFTCVYASHKTWEKFVLHIIYCQKCLFLESFKYNTHVFAPCFFVLLVINNQFVECPW